MFEKEKAEKEFEKEKAEKEFEKETVKFYTEIEKERARIQRNLLRYFGGNK